MTKRSKIAQTFFALLSITLFCVSAYAQVPVTVGPEPQTQFLDGTGIPLAGGIVCTYQAGTSTPFATYTDSTGLVQNTNPVVLNSAGRANIWWQSSAYKVVLAGGGTCGSPSNIQWTVDNFSVGVFLNGNNTWTGTNTFSGNVIVNGTFTANSGGSLNGTFSGNPNFSGSPTFTGTIVASQFQATVTTGTPPLVVASTTVVPNLNVDVVDGCVISGAPSANTTLVATSPTACQWNLASSFPSVIYSTQSASTNSDIAPVTMATPTATATYRMSYYVVTSVIGASCSNSTSVFVTFIYQDPLAAGTYTSPGTQNVITDPLTPNGAVGVPYGVNGQHSTNYYPNVFTFRAKIGVPIQYSTMYSIGSGCSPGPQYTFFPILEQLTAN